MQNKGGKLGKGMIIRKLKKKNSLIRKRNIKKRRKKEREREIKGKNMIFFLIPQVGKNIYFSDQDGMKRGKEKNLSICVPTTQQISLQRMQICFKVSLPKPT